MQRKTESEEVGMQAGNFVASHARFQVGSGTTRSRGRRSNSRPLLRSIAAEKQRHFRMKHTSSLTIVQITDAVFPCCERVNNHETHVTLALVPRSRHFGVMRQVKTVAVVALQRCAHVVVHLVVDLMTSCKTEVRYEAMSCKLMEYVK